MDPITFYLIILLIFFIGLSEAVEKGLNAFPGLEDYWIAAIVFTFSLFFPSLWTLFAVGTFVLTISFCIKFKTNWWKVYVMVPFIVALFMS